MAEDQGGGAAPKDVGDISSDSKDSVAYETYRKTVSEAKRLKEQLAEIKAQKDADDQAKLAEQGKYKEMVEKLQTDLKTKDADFKKKEAFFVQSNLKSTVSRYAKELGAIGEATEEIYEVAKSKGLLSSLEIKEDYSVNGDQIKEALSELQKKSPWFFQKSVAAPRDITVGGNASGGSSTKKLTELSFEQLAELGKNAKA